MFIKKELTGSYLVPEELQSIISQQCGNYIFMHQEWKRHVSAVKLLCNAIYKSEINNCQWCDICKDIRQRLEEGKEDPRLIVHSSTHQVVK